MSAPTLQDLATYVQAGETNTEFVSSCLAEATELVDTAIQGATVPESVYKRAVLEVGADLYYRRENRSGIAVFGTADGGTIPLRTNRDPLAAARPLLQQYVLGGIA